MKKLLTFSAMAITCLFANAQTSFDLKLYEETVKTEKQYFRDIIKVFNTDDPYLRTDDVALVYYGYAFTPEYNPIKDENEKLLNKYILEDNFPMIYKTANKILSYNPASLDALFHAWISGKTIGKSDTEYLSYVNKYKNVVAMIKEYGDGKSAETAFKIVHPEDKFHIMQSLGIKDVESETLDPKTLCYIITVTPSTKFQHRHIYFDVSIFLNSKINKK